MGYQELFESQWSAIGVGVIIVGRPKRWRRATLVEQTPQCGEAGAGETILHTRLVDYAHPCL
jgi:hypothetical protein